MIEKGSKVLKYFKAEGDWKDGKEHGKGLSYKIDGRWQYDMYDGDWKDGKKHGRGRFYLSWPRGDIYEGDWKDNNMDGFGTYTW